ncbi:MAG: mannitol dehydrogenase family protein [Eubacteriales bacterium]
MAETHLKERILQIGEGRFLRGFIGRIADQMNRSGAGIGITVVKPRAGEGIIPALNANSVYNLRIRGLNKGKTINETYEIGCILRGLNLITDYDSVEQAALSPNLRVIISNTTEAGIVYRESACTYPYYLTTMLYARFKAGLELPVVLPCELIENNGKKLREYVLKYASDLGCGEAFIRILSSADFPDTLVDSIVTSGDDETGVCAEPYYSWVIEYNPPAYIRKTIAENGINIVFTDDIRPYRQRKVAILNGAHTMSVMAGRMCGFETVREMMSDALLAGYIARGISEEVLPTLTLPREETEEYTREVIERFRNPFLQHQLKDIALNSVPKARARIIPTLLRYTELFGKPPRLLTMAVSALIAYYRSGEANDDPDTLAFIRTSSLTEILGRSDFWGSDISFLNDLIQADITYIEENGMRTALKNALDFE